MNFEDFIKRNDKLIHKIAHKYSIKNFKHEDLYQEGLMKLWDVFNTYDEQYSETTFIFTILNNYYYTLVNKYNNTYNQNYDINNNMLKEIKNFNFDILVDKKESYNDYLEEVLLIAYELLEEDPYKEGLNSILYGETYESVSQQYGVSKQYMHQRFQKYIEKVKNEVDKIEKY